MATGSIKNLNKVVAKINKISNLNLQKNVNKATVLVHGQAVENANFEKGYQTGDLKGSIHMDVKRTSDGFQGSVFTNNDHAAYVEFGTGVRGNGSYPYNPKDINLEYKEDWAGMKAQPYLYPALKEHEKDVKEILLNGTKEELQKICKRGWLYVFTESRYI